MFFVFLNLSELGDIFLLQLFFSHLFCYQMPTFNAPPLDEYTKAGGKLFAESFQWLSGSGCKILLFFFMWHCFKLSYLDWSANLPLQRINNFRSIIRDVCSTWGLDFSLRHNRRSKTGSSMNEHRFNVIGYNSWSNWWWWNLNSLVLETLNLTSHFSPLRYHRSD